MTSGIKVQEIHVGTGPEAVSGKIAVVHLRAFLNRGEECMNTYAEGTPYRVQLGKRYWIAGLEKGIGGMRVGGKRKLIVSPHLAYGAKGAGKIPPNAVLHFEVELLEVVELGTPAPVNFPPGRQLVVFRAGEAVRGLPRIQFVVHEDGRADGFVSYPVPGGSWRHSRPKPFEFQLSVTEARELIKEVLKLSEESPKGLLRHEDLWADASEKANSVTRSQQTDELCVVIQVWEPAQPFCYFALPESSPLLLNSGFYSTLMTKFSEWESHT